MVFCMSLFLTHLPSDVSPCAGAQRDGGVGHPAEGVQREQGGGLHRALPPPGRHPRRDGISFYHDMHIISSKHTSRWVSTTGKVLHYGLQGTFSLPALSFSFCLCSLRCLDCCQCRAKILTLRLKMRTWNKLRRGWTSVLFGEFIGRSGGQQSVEFSLLFMKWYLASKLLLWSSVISRWIIIRMKTFTCSVKLRNIPKSLFCWSN